MSRSAARQDWEAYARQRGLIRDETPAPSEAPRRSKYGNVKTQVNGIWFDSKKEAERFQQLTLMQQAKQISDLELQPRFPLHVMRIAYSECPIKLTKVGVFTADFSYLDLRTGECVIEDVKSEPTRTGEAYRLRRKLVEAIHGVVITEV
jgi:hypothetical protein